MRQAVRPAFFLLIVLAALAWGASILVDATSHRWLEQDVRLRAAVILSGGDGLVRSWSEGDRLGVV